MDAMTTASADAVADPERKAPGRPRSAKADEAIVGALIDMLSEGQSVAAISMEAVAARAGVGKATIYRRWANKEAMLVDAVRTMKGPPVRPPGNSVREDLLAIVTAQRSRRMEQYGKVTACLLPELATTEELRRVFQAAVVEPRREVTRAVLQRGVETGELRADLDIEMSLLMITAPGMVQNMLNWNPAIADETFVESLVDAFLRGARAQGELGPALAGLEPQVVA